MRTGVLCFIKNKNKILLIHVDYGENVLVWNGISGFVEKNEEPKKAVVREVKEEIGIELNPEFLIWKGSYNVEKDLTLEVFIAEEWKGIPKPCEKSIKEAKWFDVDKLPFDEMIKGNKDWLPSFLK